MFQLHYYYSACIGIKTKDTTILCDPWFTKGIYDGSWYQFPEINNPIETVGEYEYIYVSHIHPDHYDPVFLKEYFSKYPATKLIIANFAINFLAKKMKMDGFDPIIVDELEVGKTQFKVFPNESFEFDIDSALAVTYEGRSLVNMNDNQYNEVQLQAIKSWIGGQITICCLGYTGAGPFPQTFIMEESTKRARAREKKEMFFHRYERMRDFLNPERVMPFAGQYFLGGKFTSLNEYRGVADAVEVMNFDKKAFVLDENKNAYFDLMEMKPYGIRKNPYDKDEIQRFLKAIRDIPMDYEKEDSKELSYEDFRVLFKKSFDRAIKKSLYEKDLFLCVKFLDEYAVLNINKNKNDISFTKDIFDLNPRIEIICDNKHLNGLLSRVYHWNNAEVGSHYQIKRDPDVYIKEAFSFLNFLHI